jgi:hypothetical protein
MAGEGARLRLALLTIASPMSDAAIAAFRADPPGEIVLFGVSDPGRAAMGGRLGQVRRHLARSGPRILPYLALGFGLARPPRGALSVADVNGREFHAALAASRAELIVTCHFDQILSPETLALARCGGVNLHPSLLPRHRGPMPAFRALAAGSPQGITVHRLAPRIDAGAILAQEAVALPAGISALEAARLLHLAGVAPLRAAIAALAMGGCACPPPRPSPASCRRHACGVTGEGVRPAPSPLAGEGWGGGQAAVTGSCLRAHEAQPDPLPYEGFPDRAALAEAARRGVRLVRWRDLRRLGG